MRRPLIDLQATGSEHDRPVRRSRWWRELLIIVVFYFLYSLVRDLRGSKPVSIFQATTNAHRIISLEQHLGVFHEAAIQQFFLGDRGFIRFWDDYYGTAHFVMVILVLILLFFMFPSHYRLWRNTLAITTLIALIGYSVFPLMPPRLLPPQYHFVDTLRVYGGLWNFSSQAVNDISNQYAAMPSLHTAYAVWCALAVVPIIKPLWGKIAVFIYPLATLFCIVVTANHFFADEVAGLLVLGVSYAMARVITTWVDRWHARRELLAGAGAGPPPTGLPPLVPSHPGHSRQGA
ncbi:MAG: phosphatase PAP2 family protein, partial [Acidimicrobiales bacterium]